MSKTSTRYFEVTAENKTVVSQWNGKLLCFITDPLRCKMFSYLLLSVCLVIAFRPTSEKGGKRGKIDLESAKKGTAMHPKLKHHFPLFSYFIALRKQEKSHHILPIRREKKRCTSIFKMSARSNSKINIFSLTFCSLWKRSLTTNCFNHEATKYHL